MLLLGYSLGSLISPQVQRCRNTTHVRANIQAAPLSCIRRANSEFFGPDISSLRTIVAVQSRTQRIASFRKLRRPSAFWMPCSQIASSAFTWGTVTVLPFYTLMVLAPNGGLTKKSMESNIPYIALGVLYAYLLYLSWTPDTIRLMFSSKYWLPELAGMVRMFSSEMTLASAWIHLLAVDLFAARQIFHDGLKNNIETRHSQFYGFPKEEKAKEWQLSWSDGWTRGNKSGISKTRLGFFISQDIYPSSSSRTD